MLGQYGSATSRQPGLQGGVRSSIWSAHPVIALASRRSGSSLKLHAGQLPPQHQQRSSRQSPWWPSRAAAGRHNMPADPITAAAAAADDRSAPSQPSRRRLPNNREEPADHPSGAETPAGATAPAAVPQPLNRSQQPSRLPAQQSPGSDRTASKQPAAQRSRRQSQQAEWQPKEDSRGRPVDPVSKGGRSSNTPRQRSAEPPSRRPSGKGGSARTPQQTNGNARPPPQQREPQVEDAASLPPPVRRAATALDQQLSDASREDVRGERASRRLQQDEAWQQHCNEVSLATGCAVSLAVHLFSHIGKLGTFRSIAIFKSIHVDPTGLLPACHCWPCAPCSQHPARSS